MTSSQPHKKDEPRVAVTLSLRRSTVRKLNRRAKQQSTDDTMASRSSVAEEILTEGLR